MDPVLDALSGMKLGVFSWFVGAAVFSIAMFRWAEENLHPNIRAEVKTWFLPATTSVRPVDLAAMFRQIFEAVFGTRHLSGICLGRSLLVSFGVFTLLAGLAVIGVAETYGVDKILIYAGGILPATLVILLLTNGLSDYLSLFETRLVLSAMEEARSAVATCLYVLLDLFLTGLIYWVFAYGVATVYFTATASEMDLGFIEILAEIKDAVVAFEALVSGDLPADVPPPYLLAHVAIGASFFTTFTTSLWLWLAFLGGPIARLIVWGRDGMTLAGRILDTEAKPIACLGTVTALLILAVGVVFWAVRTVV